MDEASTAIGVEGPRQRVRGNAVTRFLRGFFLPLVALWALLRDPAARRSYLKVTFTQAAVTLALAVMLVPAYQQYTAVRDRLEAEAEAAIQSTVGAVQAKVAQSFDAQTPARDEATTGPSDATEEVQEPAVAVALGDALVALERMERPELRETLPRRTPTVPRTPVTPLPPPVPAVDSVGMTEQVQRELDQALAQAAQVRARALEQAEAERARALERAEEERERVLALAAEERTRALETAAQARTRALEQAERERQREASRVAVEVARGVAIAHPPRTWASARLSDEDLERIRRIARDAQQRALAAREGQPVEPQTITISRSLEELARNLGTQEDLGGIGKSLEDVEARLERDALQDPHFARRAEEALSIAMEAAVIQERAEVEAARLEVALAAAIAAAPDPATRAGLDESRRQAKELARQARELARAGREQAKRAFRQVAASDAGLPLPEVAAAIEDLSPTRKVLLFFAALYAALYFVQTLVIWLSRDFHDRIQRQASLALGLAPEDPDIQPRVRVDWPGMKRRLGRRWRNVKAFILGLPLLYVVSLPWPAPADDYVWSALLTAWGAYWFAVAVASRTSRAWTREGVAGAPWFVRGATAVVDHLPGLLARPLRAVGRFCERQVRGLYPPAEWIERRTPEFAGLTLFRALIHFPLLKLFLRPLAVVAAAQLIEQDAAPA